MVAAEQPLTRRELHRARGTAAQTGPSRALSRTCRAAVGVLPRVQQMTHRLSFEAVAAATAIAFVGGAVTGVVVDTADRQAETLRDQVQAQQERVDRAGTVRLTAGAAQYAAARERQALVAAQAALADANEVLRTAPALVGDATVDPLDEAMSELAVLVAAVERDTVPVLRTDVPVTVVSDTDPTDDASDAAPPGPEATGAITPSPAELDGTGSSSADPAAADVTPPGVADGAEATALALVGVSPSVLDLDTSGALIAAAQEVAALSAQVTALRDAVAVELADAAEAAEARRAEEEAKRIAAERAVLEAALARMSTRISATDAAPNGQIPIDLLCRPRFADVLLRCDAAAALDELNAAYRSAVGRDLAVSGGYRTYGEQQQARATKGDLAATPGTSNHGRALAVDFSGFGGVGQFNDPDYLWMVENGPRFGWVHPPGMGPGGSGPLEPWHWEFGDL